MAILTLYIILLISEGPLNTQIYDIGAKQC